jgi:hypothetical protein
MQHSNDNVLNILKTTKRCIDTCSKSSQVYMKKEVFRIARKHEVLSGKLLSAMTAREVELVEDDAIEAIS